MSNRRAHPFGGSGLDRRAFLQRAGLAAVVVGTPSLLSACAAGPGGGGGNGGDEKNPGDRKVEPAADVTGKNPFGVDPKAPLEVVIFNGGFGEDYAKFHESLYSKAFPGAKIDHTATQEITKTQQPKFVSKKPVDVINNSGAQQIDPSTLWSNGQLQSLQQLLDGPSYDDANTKVKETVEENTFEAYTYDGVPYGLDYTLNISGLWYDAKLFRDNDLEFPKTWDELLALGAQLKKGIQVDGQKKSMPLWIYQGQHPSYMITVFNAIAQKAGGNEVMRKVDNLEDGAWTDQPAMLQTAEALEELKKRGYIMPNTAPLTHIQAQAAWLRHKAAIIPCGSWLLNEMRSQWEEVKDNFEMTVASTPSLSDKDKMPFDSIPYAPGEPFHVPFDAKNPAGGMEYLRIMLSKAGAQKFAELTNTLTVVKGAHEEQKLGPVVESSQKVVNKAKQVERMDQVRYSTWYEPLKEDAEQAIGTMMTTDKLDAKGFIERVQKKADEVKKNKRIKKQTR